MKPITSIGECLISTADHDYFFKPSFINMTRIGAEGEIVGVYSTLNGYEISRVVNNSINNIGMVPECIMKAISKPAYGKPILNAAILVMQSCCDDDISPLVGTYKPTPRGMKYMPGMMPIKDIVIIGKSLAEHGIIGKVNRRVLQREEGKKSNYSNSFRVIDYISSARTHFNMTREEAQNLTMTEFQELIKIKFPDTEKGLTRDEYDATKVAYLKKQKERIERAKANGE